jgi:hypothetical protein
LIRRDKNLNRFAKAAPRESEGGNVAIDVGSERKASQLASAARRPGLPFIVPNIFARLTLFTQGSHRFCALYGHIKPKSF